MHLVMSMGFRFFEIAKGKILYPYKIVLSLSSGCRLYDNAVCIMPGF